MKLETFFEKFDQFADAPDAVTKMRELVLELAVQGKLSEQRAADAKEPAWQKLTTQLEAESSASISDIEPPFEIPSWWRWTTLERLGDTKPRNDAPDSAKSSFVPMTLIPAEYGQSARHEERPWGEIKKGYTHFKTGDVVMAKITPCFENGKSAVMNGLTGGFGAGTTELHVFRRTGEGVLPEFVILYLKTRGFITRGIPRMTGSAGQKRVPSDYFARSPFPLPPLAEQKRIVAKVDELMALCDRLEAQQQERETRHAALARASLARFADAPTPANFPFLFHPSYPIPPADLRKSILTLAVQGKLVSQDPNDEPAETILRATCSLFERLVAAKKLSSPKPLPAIEEGEFPFSLPSGWAWCRLGQIMRISSGDGLIAKDMNDGPIPVYGGNGVNGYHDAHNVAKRTLVIGRVGFYCGSIHVTPERAWVTDNAFITTFDEDHVDMDFLSWLLKATYLRERDNATAQPVISGGKVYPTILALPPLTEQRRIVAKVNELMALVDELETQLAAARATTVNLLEALVAELTAAKI